jgi:hypothetical protein
MQRQLRVGIGSTVTLSFPVGKGNQTITFTSTAPAGATVGGPTYNVTATASSDLTVRVRRQHDTKAVDGPLTGGR